MLKREVPMTRSQVLASVILALLVVAGAPVRAEQKPLTAEEQKLFDECEKADTSCKTKCPPSPERQRNDCVNRCAVKLMTCLSDIRVKRDILQVGRLDNGIRLYRYRYVWDDQIYVGVMAQEVAEIMPEAVVRGADGYLRVDYGQLGLRLKTWDEWTASY
jgi:hypothetical protein